MTWLDDAVAIIGLTVVLLWLFVLPVIGLVHVIHAAVMG